MALVALASPTARAQSTVATLPVSQIKPGQQGYGLTVFSGFKVERFKVEVIDVLRQFLPKQDIILMRGDHAVLQRAGVLGGMSGSPIYIDGKLVGALAYGWRFSKEPIFGVTPIGNMRTLLKRKLRGPAQAGSLMAAAPAMGTRSARTAQMQHLLAHLADRSDPWVKLWFPRRRLLPNSSLLVRASVPLQVSGLGQGGVAQLKKAFSSFGFEPVQGGGSGKAEGPTRFEIGGAIGVTMASGDISMTGTGTVTHIEGNKVLAFGHSMFNAGEIYLPVVSARINHSHANLARSFKLSSPARTLGALQQDRQAAIMADTQQRVPMMPMSLTLRSRGETYVYRLQVARHRFLTPSLVSTLVSNAVTEAVPDVAAASFDIKTRIEVKGHPAVVISDQSYAEGGLRMGALMFSRGLRAVRLLATNPLGPLDLQRVDVEIGVDFGLKPVRLVQLTTRENQVQPGATTTVTATYRTYGGKRFSKRYQLHIPKGLAGTVVNVELAGGRFVRPDAPTPQTITQLLALVQKGYPGRSVVLSLYQPSTSLALDGQVLANLPSSVVDALQAGSAPQEVSMLQSKQRHVFATPEIVTGRQMLRLRVKSEVE